MDQVNAIRLNPELTPNLEHLSFSADSESAEISVLGDGIFPAMTCMNFSGFVVGECVRKLLSAARLENVSFSLMEIPAVNGRKFLEFANCALREIRLQFVHGLEEVSFLGAPNVREIELHACNDLKIVRGLEELRCLQAVSLRAVEQLVVEKLHLASNNIRSVEIDGVHTLRTITLGAPNLTEMKLVDCKLLENVYFFNEHDIKSSLPAHYVVPHWKTS